MKIFDYAQNEDKIRKALNKKISDDKTLNDPEGYTILEGFITPTVNIVIKEGMPVSGPAFPMILIVGNSDSKVTMYSVASLFPIEMKDV